MREIPKKNYFVLAILSILTIIIVFLFFNIYDKYNKSKESYISRSVLNINCNDLKNVLLENNILFVYIDNISNTKDRDIEKSILEKIGEYDLKKYLVFYNNNDIDNIKYFKDKYKIDIKKKKMLVVFEDGILTESLILSDDFENEIIQTIISIGALDD